MAAAKQLQGLSSVLSLIQGMQGQSASGTTTTSGSQTTKSDMTQAGMDRVLQQILGGPGGVKDISGAARGAGLYNSSTEAQMLNDLAARSAGELEKLRAGTTTNSNQVSNTTQETPGMSLGSMIKPLAMMGLGKPLLGGLSSMMSGGDFLKGAGMEGLANLFTGTGATAANLSANLAPDLSNITVGSGMEASMGTSLSGIGDAYFDLGGGAADSLVAAPSIDLGATMGAETMADTTFSATLNNSIPGLGSFLGGLLGGKSPEDMDGFGLGASALMGAMAMGPVGLIAAPMMAILGSAMGDISIICTALVSRGLLDVDEYLKGQEYLKSVSPITKQGYYYLCTDIAAKISNGNEFWTFICLPFARSRTKLIAEGKGWKRWVRYPLGTLTKVIGEPICWCVGKYRLAYHGPMGFYQGE